MKAGFAAMEAKFEGLSERVDAQSGRMDTLAGEVAARQLAADEKVDALVGEVGMLKAGRPCIIAGVTGRNTATVNGTYHPTDEIYNDRVLFRKEGDGDKWLRYVTQGGNNYWMVGDTSDKDANKSVGWAHCVEKGLHDPAEAATWEVYDGQKFTVQPAITCVHR
jgi:hypothetical protein